MMTFMSSPSNNALVSLLSSVQSLDCTDFFYYDKSWLIVADLNPDEPPYASPEKSMQTLPIKPSKLRLGKLLLPASLMMILSACHMLIPPKQTPAKLLEKTRSSIITNGRVSAATQSILVSAGYTQESCMADFEACVDDVRSIFFIEMPNRLQLSVFSELYYTYADNLIAQEACRIELARPPIDPYYTNAPISKDIAENQQKARTECHAKYRDALYQTVKYSYAYLFYYSLGGHGTPSSLPQESDIRTLDLYHLAINDLITQIYRKDHGAFYNAKFQDVVSSEQLEPIYNQLRIGRVLSNDHGQNTLHISVGDRDFLTSKLKQHEHSSELFSEMISAYDSRLLDLDVNARRSGLGVSFVGAINDRHTTSIDNLKKLALNKALDDRIHHVGHIQLTAIIKPTGNTIDEVLSSHEFYAYFFNPSNNTHVKIGDTSYPLTANFSAGYALWLAENQLRQVSLTNMISRSDAIALPELFMLKPYNPDQKVIIMLHGLASSPATWVNLTNTLLTDSKLNENYQVWQVAYATNLPILENRYQIHELIRHTFAKLDPNGQDKASHNAVLIGHSMGGVISRLLVSDTDLTQKLHTLGHKEQYKLINHLSADQRQTLSNRLVLSSLPQVDEAIFLSAPHRGTDYADRWFTRAARRIIKLPIELTRSLGTIFTNDIQSQSFLGTLYLQNGASQLSDHSSFMALTKDIQISPSVRYHSIIGNHTNTNQQGDAVGKTISDGIVPYTSSHLEGAASEIIVEGKHNTHENPKTIVQLRKILHEHLDQ